MNTQAEPRQVAVIIPTYNSAAYLARAIKSVLTQTYCHYQIVVVDDGSTDDTQVVLKSFEGQIVSLYQPNSGQACARNRGIRSSQSRYIAFLDADDEWVPRKLEKQIAFLEDNPDFAMVYSDCITSGTGPFAGPHFARIGRPATGRVFAQFLDNCNVFTPTVVVRRDCLESVGAFNESLRVSEDFNLWLRIAAVGKIGAIEEALAIRHPRHSSLSSTTPANQMLANSVACFEDVLQRCTTLPPNERNALRHKTASRHYEYGSYLLLGAEHRAARVQFFEAMRRGRREWRLLTKLVLSYLPHKFFSTAHKLKARFWKIRQPKTAGPFAADGSRGTAQG